MTFRRLAFLCVVFTACEPQPPRAHRSAGEPCTRNWQCIGFDCSDGTCQRSRVRAECDRASQCALGLECDEHRATCLAPASAACADGLDCASGRCVAHACAP